MVTASRRDDCSEEWDINSAAGSLRQEVLWEEECYSNLITNIREAKDDPLPPAVLDGRMLLGCPSGLSRAPSWRAEGLWVLCKRGSPPPTRSVNTRDLRAKSGLSHKPLISELATLQLYTGKWNHRDWITCPGVPGWSQLTPTFLVQLLIAPAFYSRKCPDSYSILRGHTFWHSM